MRSMKKIASLLLLAVAICSMKQTIIYAQSVWGGHLIQTTDYKDEYLGALHLGLLEVTAQEDTDIDQNAQRVSSCIVRIHCGDSVGSGVVLALTEENVVIVSNTHLLQNDVVCKVDFIQGFTVEGEVICYSDQYDMAFVRISLEKIPMQQWECLRYVDMQVDSAQIMNGDAIMQIGSSTKPAGDCYYGGILNKNQYMPEYGTEMIKTGCQAYVGMSGGGIFDSRGYLLGMITGGEMTQESRENGTEITYGIPVGLIREEFYAIIGTL